MISNRNIAVAIICTILAITAAFAVAAALLMPARYSRDQTPTRTRGFDVQSVDAMKFSRDVARQKLSDEKFDAVIDEQTRGVAELGATHIAIGTPYDPEFLPFMRRWVASARTHGLSVWFRGNFSGWEGWFGYKKIGRAEHLDLTEKFILGNPDLFQDGDIFTSCPECENGGPGDPRMNGDVDGHRAFLADEYDASVSAFRSIGKDVESGYFSMNTDVAMLIMDKPTIDRVGGIVSLDHYVRDTASMDAAIRHFAELGARVVIGEFGAPIPDLNGAMTQEEQARFIGKLFSVFYENNLDIKGVNYWVIQGGSTALINDDGSKRQAFETIKEYYKAPLVLGTVTDIYGMPLPGVSISLQDGKYSAVTDRWGNYEVFAPFIPDTISIGKPGFASSTLEVIKIDPFENHLSRLEPTDPDVTYRLQSFLFAVRERFDW